MNGADIIAVIILAAIVIAVLAYLLHWLYRRSTKDVSFVRTGLGGEKIIMGGGAFILPIVHDLTEVSMNTLRLQVTRAREKALITKDRMRIELEVEFYVRVVPNPAEVATAARTLGRRTMDPEKLRELVQGRFVDAMGTVAASMTLEEMHEHRDRFIAGVKAEVVKDLGQNGLELEAVSLVSLDQADMKLFNPANAFDAEGLTRLTQEIELRKKKRNDIEQDTMIAIRNKNLEAEKLSLEISKESEYARLAQESEIARRRAQQGAEVERERAARERDIEAARIQEREEVERTRIAMERQLEELEIKRIEARELAEQAREIAIAEKSQERSRIQTAAEEARRLCSRRRSGSRPARKGGGEPSAGDRTDRGDARPRSRRSRSKCWPRPKVRGGGSRRGRSSRCRSAEGAGGGRGGSQACDQRSGEPALRRQPSQRAASEAGRSASEPDPRERQADGTH